MFWKDLPKSVVQQELLPFFHSTESVNARDIFSVGSLQTSLCKVYDEELVYLFYGRPAYRPNSSILATKILEFFPIVFVLEPSAARAVQRIMPFDSGGFENGKFSEFVHPSLTKDKFVVPPPVSNILSIVEYFFGTNSSYFSGRGVVSAKPPQTKFELATFYRMVNSDLASQSDDRRITCEIQSNEAIGLNETSVCGIIAPAVFEDEEYFSDKITQWDCLFEGYDIFIANPRETTALILDKSKTMLKRLGRL